MIIRVGPLIVTRFVVVDSPIAWNGSITLVWGLVPAAAMAIIVIMHVVPTFFNIVTRLVRRVCVLLLSTTRSAITFCGCFVTQRSTVSLDLLLHTHVCRGVLAFINYVLYLYGTGSLLL